MLCLCGFELYSRWVPLNVYVSLGKKLGLCVSRLVLKAEDLKSYRTKCIGESKY